MKILGVLLAFVGFALGIYEIINTLRGKENKRILCGVAIAYLGYGVCYSVSQKDLGYIGVAFLFGLIFYAIRVMCVLLRMAAKREKRSLKNDLIVLAVLLVGFIAGMMLPYDKEEEAKRTAESDASVMEEAVLPLAGLDYTLDDVNWLEQTDDWAAGSRYNAQINGKIYIQIATIDDEIYSIKDTKKWSNG